MPLVKTQTGKSLHMTIDRIEGLRKTLWPEGMPGYRRVFAVLDGAKDTAVFGAVDASRQDKTCLYSVNPRWLPADLAWNVVGIAPYLIELDPDEKSTNSLLRKAWEGNWGIFLRTAASIEALRRHLRHFLTAYTESGKMLMFRFYDPCVFRVYLPTCTPDELRIFFGPISAFIAPSRNPDRALRFCLSGTELVEEVQALADNRPFLPIEPGLEPVPRSQKPIRVTVRNSQMARFRQTRMQDFENRMLEHVSRFFAGRFNRAGEQRIRELIQEGIGRAAKYGFRTEQEICRFIDLMVVFGPRFDQDADWAARVLLCPGQGNRLEQLLAAATAHLRMAG